MFIEDGTGTGRRAAVTMDNRLVTRSFNILDLERINEEDGQVFSIPLEAVAPSGATQFFVFQNNGQSTYAIYSVMLASSAAGVIRLAKVTGTPASGTAIIANSMNLGQVSILDNILLQTGTSITGLTEVGPLQLIYLPANSPLILDIPSRIYLPPGAMFSLKAAGAATINGTLLIYRESDND